MSKLEHCAGFGYSSSAQSYSPEESNRMLECFNLAWFNLKKGRLMTGFQNLRVCYKEDYILLFSPPKIDF